jgi:hypothetical protein
VPHQTRRRVRGFGWAPSAPTSGRAEGLPVSLLRAWRGMLDLRGSLRSCSGYREATRGPFGWGTELRQVPSCRSTAAATSPPPERRADGLQPQGWEGKFWVPILTFAPAPEVK